MKNGFCRHVNSSLPEVPHWSMRTSWTADCLHPWLREIQEVLTWQACSPPCTDSKSWKAGWHKCPHNYQPQPWAHKPGVVCCTQQGLRVRCGIWGGGGPDTEQRLSSPVRRQRWRAHGPCIKSLIPDSGPQLWWENKNSTQPLTGGNQTAGRNACNNGLPALGRGQCGTGTPRGKGTTEMSLSAADRELEPPTVRGRPAAVSCRNTWKNLSRRWELRGSNDSQELRGRLRNGRLRPLLRTSPGELHGAPWSVCSVPSYVCPQQFHKAG